MHLLHKNQENFSHKKFRPADPISKIDHFDPLFGFSDPKITEVVWVEKSGRKIFFEIFTFLGPKGAEKRDFCIRIQKVEVEPTFFEKVRFLDFLKFF